MAVLVTIALVSGTSAFAVDGNSRMREIADGVYSFTLGEGNHSMFVIGESGVVVFDTFDSGHSAAMLEAIRSVTDKPIRVAILCPQTLFGRATGKISTWAISPSRCTTWV